MNIQTALLPHKHTSFSRSILATAGVLRSYLGEPRTLDELSTFAATNPQKWPIQPSFTEILLAVYLLVSIKQAHLVHDDRIQATVTQ
jgi:hypothetical protein